MRSFEGAHSLAGWEKPRAPSPGRSTQNSPADENHKGELAFFEAAPSALLFTPVACHRAIASPIPDNSSDCTRGLLFDSEGPPVSAEGDSSGRLAGVLGFESRRWPTKGRSEHSVNPTALSDRDCMVSGTIRAMKKEVHRGRCQYFAYVQCVCTNGV